MFSIAVIFSLVRLSLLHSVCALSMKPSVGFHYERLEDVFVYESSLPILFTYDLPVNEFPTNFTLFQRQSCPWNFTHPFPRKGSATIVGELFSQMDDILTTNLRCHETAAIEEINLNLHNEVKNFPDHLFEDSLLYQTRTNSSSRGNRGIDTILGEIFSFCCSLATKKTTDKLYKNQKFLTDNVNQIIESVHENHRNLVSSTRLFTEFSAKVIENTEKTQENLEIMSKSLDQATQEDNKIINFVLNNFYKTILNIYLLHQQSIFKEIKVYCEKQRIPSPIISRNQLIEELLQLGDRLIERKIRLAIPIEKIEFYYSEPITSCQIFQDKVLIKIQVPLMRQSSNFNTYKITPIPLEWENSICNIVKEELLIINSSYGLNQLASGQHLVNHKLIHLTRYQIADRLSPSCIKQILSGSTIFDLRKICQFNCQAKGSQPIITAISDHTFLISSLQENLFVKCEDNSSETLPSSISGYIEVNLPCTCKLYQQEDILIQEQILCGAREPQLQITHRLPYTWMKIENLFLDPKNLPQFPTHSELLDLNWNTSYLTFNISESGQMEKIRKIKLPGLMDSILEGHSFVVTIILCWNGIISLFCIVQYIQIKFIRIKMRQNYRPQLVTLERLR